MNNTYYSQLNKYLENASNILEINWFDLPLPIYLLLKDSNKLITIKKLIKNYGKDKKLNGKIHGIKTSIKGGILGINFPINLNQESYIKLYALMISEGSIRTEFSLNVPEKEFHDIFEENLKKIISEKIIIKKDFNKGFERSRAPAIIRYLLPFSDCLPQILFKNKEFAREYLKIVFEAEGCPIFNLKKHKKYIKLSRNSDASKLFIKEKSLPSEERIFINKIKQDYPVQYIKLIKKPGYLILGEHLLLKHWFNIDSTLKLENIRSNRLGNRKGKITVKWVLYIYSGEDIERFNKDVGFISTSKQKKCKAMLEKIPSRKKQYTALKVMKNIQKRNVFSAEEFNKKMKIIGYVSPQKFLWDYWKNKKLIERIGRGRYKLIQKSP